MEWFVVLFLGVCLLALFSEMYGKYHEREMAKIKRRKEMI
jgi:hypothetical protein